MANLRFEIQSYAIELGVRGHAVDNDRAIVPFHQLLLQGLDGFSQISAGTRDIVLLGNKGKHESQQ